MRSNCQGETGDATVRTLAFPRAAREPDWHCVRSQFEKRNVLVEVKSSAAEAGCDSKPKIRNDFRLQIIRYRRFHEFRSIFHRVLC